MTTSPSARTVWPVMTVLAMVLWAPPARAGGAIGLESLLREMVDRDAQARWPDPPYVARLASSYDRRSKTPDDAGGWFANHDNMDQPLNAWTVEQRDGRHEWVLMDVEGPGCVVRFWTGGSPAVGTVRFYLDGSNQPVIAERLGDLLAGKAWAPAPLAIQNAGNAGNLYLPVPYAKRCKITYEQGGKDAKTRPPGRWYNIEYRTWPAGTAVETFTRARFDELKDLVQRTALALAEPTAPADGEAVATGPQTLQPGKSLAIDLPAGARAVHHLVVRVKGLVEGQPNQALRSTIVRASFDGQETVWAPLGEFFGCGLVPCALNNWTRSAGTDGQLACRWVMPYRRAGRIVIENLGKEAVEFSAEARVKPWQWDERSMHFHATWRYQWPIQTRPFSDWNYLTATGRGVYVGDTLALVNTAKTWWGEGDEKVWVDGGDFPSHFGTGTEDHYGYAWGNAAVFQGPFCNQPAPSREIGHRTNTRIRVLDAIPFTRSLRYDMEVWHWADCKVAYGVACYWYAVPGATTTARADPAAAGEAIPLPGGPAKIKGAVECETMKVLGKSEGLNVSTQKSYPFAEGQWSDDEQLFVRATKPGAFIELQVAEGVSGPRKVVLHATRSHDYGILRFSVNGKKVEKEFDGWHKEPVLSGPVELGTFDPRDGRIVLRVEVTGANPQSRGPKYYFGLDAVLLQAP
ncbi:MAG: hypothetical protein BWX88_04996 [Planctomycetes bacterium ADurb.Bin126]|nr:MAG: hypothetical protein BWX88_04996 [Planctomycetes bacterium ADurb.Bin126]HOD84137.1 DUF2961 domain-containing protein [Phycisphaerae bacterium]HQL76127.1 DUF2961 domain-containing protein [Phycisphaerae bacterium]